MWGGLVVAVVFGCYSLQADWLSAKQTENPAIGWVFCLSVPGALAALDSQRHALTTTNAQCRQTLVGIPALHFVQQADQNPAA